MIKTSKPLPSVIDNYQIMQSMRSTMLHIQCLLRFLDESIEQQDRNIERQLKDRLMQLMEIYQKHSALELSNTTKYLILQLEEILTLQSPLIQQMWERLDIFVEYLKGLKNLVRNFTRKIHFGRNIGIDVEKLNLLVRKTKVFLMQLMQEHRESIQAYSTERELSNQIFSTMEQYCKQIQGILALVAQKYPKYIEDKLRAQEEATKGEIEGFTQNLLY